MSWRCPRCGSTVPDGRSRCDSCGAGGATAADRVGTSSVGETPGPPSAAGTPPPHRSFGRYRLERHIASGGFASVHLGRDTATGVEVALKILASNLVHQRKLVARFLQEARIQITLRHPGIVRVYDVVQEAGNVALVMEFVRGTTLGALLDQAGRPLTSAECREILVPMLDALEHAHRAGVVHRDLKPANVLLEVAPQLPIGYWPKLADFGVAKVFHEAGVRTLTGATLGTPWYMAPEQCRGEGAVDHRADVYSAGILLFEMATGRVPFDGESEYAIWEGHIRLAPPRPRTLNPALSVELEEVILQAIQKDPGERFQSAVALRDALQASTAATFPSPATTKLPRPEGDTGQPGGVDGAPSSRRRTIAAVVLAVFSVLVVTLGAVVASRLSEQAGGASGSADAAVVAKAEAPAEAGAPDDDVVHQEDSPAPVPEAGDFGGAGPAVSPPEGPPDGFRAQAAEDLDPGLPPSEDATRLLPELPRCIRRGDALENDKAARRYLQKNRPSQAMAHVMQALGCANHPQYWRRLGDTYVQLGDDPRAFAAYERALDLLPDDVATLLRKGNLQWRLGDESGARQTWARACDAAEGESGSCRLVQEGLPDQESGWRVCWGTSGGGT